MPTISEIIADKLVEVGIKIVFGLPGGESVPLLEAMRARNIEFVLVHNEASAVYMADATARLTGKPGVCLTTLGPGATNAAAGIAHAYLDRAPVLFLTARMWHELEESHTHQTIDQSAVFAPITKATIDLRPENVYMEMDRALALTMEGRPGPVHVQVSRQVALLDGVVPLAFGESAGSLQQVDQDALVIARSALSRADRPLILVGLGLEPQAPYGALKLLVESLEAAVVLTPKAKGAISAENLSYAGTLGLSRTDPVYELIGQSDCILAIGFDVVELVKPWEEDTPLIWLAGWENEDVAIPAIASLVGEMAPALEYLSDRPHRDRHLWQQTISDFKQRQAERTLPPPSDGRLLPQTVLNAIRASVPDDTLLTTDVGSHKILSALEWPAYTPNRYMLSNGLSSMGFGLPAAIAASLALNRQPTIAIMGDGGFSMVIGELELITRLQTPVIVVVMNDNALDLIRAAQWRSGYEAHGTEFTNPDIGKIAAAYGIMSRQASSYDACADAVQRAIATNRPIIIEALIDPVSYPTTPPRL